MIIIILKDVVVIEGLCILGCLNIGVINNKNIYVSYALHSCNVVKAPSQIQVHFMWLGQCVKLCYSSANDSRAIHTREFVVTFLVSGNFCFGS